MDLVRRRNERLTPRQAVVAMHVPVAGSFVPPTVWTATLLDVLGTLIAVNGIALGVAFRSRAEAAPMLDDVPVGVDVLVGKDEDEEQGTPALRAARWMLDRAFARVVLVAGDCVGLSPRGVTTALSVLGREPAVVGTTATGGVYLLGMTGEEGFATVRGANWAPSLLEGAPPTAPFDRRLAVVEPLRRLGDFGSLDELRRSVETAAGAMPRTMAALAAGGR